MSSLGRRPPARWMHSRICALEGLRFGLVIGRRTFSWAALDNCCSPHLCRRLQTLRFSRPLSKTTGCSMLMNANSNAIKTIGQALGDMA